MTKYLVWFDGRELDIAIKAKSKKEAFRKLIKEYRSLFDFEVMEED